MKSKNRDVKLTIRSLNMFFGRFSPSVATATLEHPCSSFFENYTEKINNVKGRHLKKPKVAKIDLVKLLRAYGGCLGAKSRRRARLTAKCHGES